MFVPFAHLTQAEIQKKDALVVLPLAAMETHGPHLPLATDQIIVDGILDLAMRLDDRAATVLRLPTLWLGASAEHADRAGTLSVDPELLIAQIVAVGGGLARCGVRRVLLFNGHGGNIAAASIAALKLRIQFDMLAASAHWLDFGLPQGLTAPAPVVEDLHGGWIETSALLHLAPDLVGKVVQRPQSVGAPAASLFPRGPIAWGWKTTDLGTDGWIGRPDLATAALGSALTEHAARRLLGLAAELAAALWPLAP